MLEADCKLTGKVEFCGRKHIEDLRSSSLGLPLYWVSLQILEMKQWIYPNTWRIPETGCFPYASSIISPTSCGFIDRTGDNIVDTLRYIICIVLAIINFNMMAYLEL